MDIKKLLTKVKTFSSFNNIEFNQIKYEDDDDSYDVYEIKYEGNKYILKSASIKEIEVYEKILLPLNIPNVPKVYEIFESEGEYYLLMEYIDGDNLCKANKKRLILALDALINIQKKTWEDTSIASYGYNFEMSLKDRETRKSYLKDHLLNEIYNRYLDIYKLVPKALTHDDLLPFNLIINNRKSILIDWEYAGLLPYPSSFTRLIAFGETNKNSLFYISKENKKFAIDYYYDNLLKDKGISYQTWIETYNYFAFYEYTEWIFIGNKNEMQDNENYKKYLLKAKKLAIELE